MSVGTAPLPVIGESVLLPGGSMLLSDRRWLAGQRKGLMRVNDLGGRSNAELFRRISQILVCVGECNYENNCINNGVPFCYSGVY
jgi:hypothetical protein